MLRGTTDLFLTFQTKKISRPCKKVAILGSRLEASGRIVTLNFIHHESLRVATPNLSNVTQVFRVTDNANLGIRRRCDSGIAWLQ